MADAREEVERQIERAVAAMEAGDVGAGIGYAEAGVEIARRAGDDLLLAQALLALGRMSALPYDRARSILDRAAALLQGTAEVTLAASVEVALARVLSRHGEIVEAERRLERATELLADSPEALADTLLQRGLFAIRRRALHEAEGQLQQARALSRRPRIQGGVLRGLGMIRLQAGDIEAARSLYEAALEQVRGLDPRLEAIVLNDLGEIASSEACYDEAVAWFRRAAEVEPDEAMRAMMRLNEALARLSQGRPQEAAAAIAGDDPLALAAEHPPWSAVAALIRAACADAAGEEAEADRWFDHASGWFQRHPTALHDVGSSLERIAADIEARAGADRNALGRALRVAGLGLDLPTAAPKLQAFARAAVIRLAARGARLPLGDHELERPIGAGGMGEVWLGRRRRSGVPVAVKFLTDEHAARPECLDALSREIRAAASLDHPAVATPYDTGRVGPVLATASGGRLREGTPFFVMEHAAGGSLAPWCGRLGWADTRRLLLELLEGLAHAHARGLVHLDLKPENVLLASASPPAGVRLADFGLARALSAGDRAVVAGTPAYMAPEQCLRSEREIGTWTDLYAVGAIAWALLHGEPPFAHPDPREVLRAQVSAPLPPFLPRARGSDVAEAWIATLLRKDPAHRFHRAVDAAAALRALPADVGGASGPIEAVTQPTGATTFVFDAADLHAHRGADPHVARAPVAPLPADWRGGDRPSGVSLPPPIRLLGLRVLPLFGRAELKDALWGALRDAAAGQATAVVLEGPAGIGKSRAAAWLVERAHEAGASILSTGTTRVGATSGIREMLARFLRADGLAGARLEAQVARAAFVRGASLDAAAVADALGGPEESSVGPIAAAIAGLAAARPVMVVLEDAHADAAALRLARLLLTAFADARVLIALAVRDDALVDHPAQAALVQDLLSRGARRLPVGPLDASATRALLDRMARLDNDLVEDLVARAGGHPQFLVELVLDWAQRGLLDHDGDDIVRAPSARLELPDDLHAVWTGRVDRLVAGLEGDARTALQLAAVLGVQVDLDEWRRACAAAGIAPPENLRERLLDQRLAVSTATGITFSQAMLRECALREAGDRAPRLHAWASLALGPKEEGRRGLHLVGSGAHEQALAPLVAGMQAARAQGDLAFATELSEAWDQAFRASGLPADDVAALRGIHESSLVARARGDSPRQVALARRAIALARQHDDPRRVAVGLLMLAHALRRTADIAEAEEVAREGLARARTLGDADVIGQALHTLGATLLTDHRLDEAEAVLREAVAGGRAEALNELGILLRERGALEEAEAVLLAYAEGCAARGERTTLVAAWNGVGTIRSARGNTAGAEACFRFAAERAEAAGRLDAVVPRLNQASEMIARGALHEALPIARSVAVRAARIGREDLIAGAAAAELAIAASDPEDAPWNDAVARLRARTHLAWPADLLVILDIAAERAAAAGQLERAATARELRRTTPGHPR